MAELTRLVERTYEHRTGSGWTQYETPGHRCAECYRLADEAQEQGLQWRPADRVRERVANGRRAFGALCQRHSEEERCWRFQAELRRRYPASEDEHRGLAHAPPEGERDLLEQHRQGCHRRSVACWCGQVAVRGSPLTLLTEQERFARRAAKRLHPCAGQCGVELVEGVGRCFTCGGEGGRS